MPGRHAPSSCVISVTLPLRPRKYAHMGQRLLPQNLIDLYAHSLAIEREAFKRFIELERFMRDVGLDHIADEFEKIGKEEQEQYEALAVGTAERTLPALDGRRVVVQQAAALGGDAHARRVLRDRLDVDLDVAVLGAREDRLAAVEPARAVERESHALERRERRAPDRGGGRGEGARGDTV